MDLRTITAALSLSFPYPIASTGGSPLSRRYSSLTRRTVVDAPRGDHAARRRSAQPARETPGRRRRFRGLPSLFAFVGYLALIANRASAQPVYSIDFHGPTMGVPDSFSGTPITEGDLLTPGAAVPAIVMTGGAGGLDLPDHATAVGHLAGVPGFVEVDALSFGKDRLVRNDGQNYQWSFSVDEFATGLFPPPPSAPNVSSQGAATMLQASADIYESYPVGLIGAGPPPMGPGANTLVWDGDGVAPAGYPSLELIEWNPPVAGVPDLGDNVDALDLDAKPGFPVYFSLDANFGDPLEGIFHSDSAVKAGFFGADVLVSTGAAGAPALYASAFSLGLDLAGPGADDLDALILRENGDGVFTPGQTVFDWQDGSCDMIFFSVRRGSSIIGVADSLRGIPIMPGDILFPFGAAGTPPGIWIPAERLGLCTARCAGCACGMFPDDLNALDVTIAPQQFVRADCNDDGVVNFLDLVSLNSLLNGGGFVPSCKDACDVNDDGMPSPADAAYLVGFLFGGGALPPAPFPGCGIDPTDDDGQSCISSSFCP